MSIEKLHEMADKVLALDPNKPKGPLQVIAGAPDRPLVIGDVKIPCYVLEDETRVFSQRGLTGAVGLNPNIGYRIPQLLASKALEPFVNNELTPALKSPITFKNPSGGGNALGYPATLLVDLCRVVLDARDADRLTFTRQQLAIAERCDTLIRALATVGVIALVDEVTGYQRIREERALATILERLIDKKLNPWTRTFPFEFYRQICRLKGWPSANAIKRPSVIGKYTNDFVYDRLAPSVLKELRVRNPVIHKTGRRQHRHHQWFMPDMGHPKLLEHLAGVIAVMRVSSNWDAFKRNVKRAYPKPHENTPLNFGED